MHTPGPWVAIRSQHRWTRIEEKPIFNNGIWHILPESNVERLPICTVDRGDDHHAPTREHAEVDAKLIAAAPEMLEALKRVDENWTGKFSGPDDPVALNRFSDTTIAIWRSIRDAIAKAEGRQ